LITLKRQKKLKALAKYHWMRKLEKTSNAVKTKENFLKMKSGKISSLKLLLQKWLKSNPNKTYKDAIDAYMEIENTKGKAEIGKQFQYNQYIRDFFENNTDKTLTDAIECWKYKKSLKGTNKYEASDLKILKN
jgi:hypothetical protein